MSEAEVKVDAPRIVTMEDGSQVNFGKLAKQIAVVEDSTITFKLFNGRLIPWTVDTEGLSDFQKTVFLFGLVEKIKSNTSSVKDLAELEVAIKRQMVLLESGQFYSRGTNTGVLLLDNLQKAYALVKSQQEGFEHLANLEDPEVTREVVAYFDSLTRAQKNIIRKHPAVVIAKARLDAENSGEGAELI